MNEEQTKEFVEKIKLTGDIRRFYKTYQWRKFRNEIMNKKKNRCELCWNGGITGEAVRRYKRATVLHHIKHLRDAPQLALREKNMMALCDECHKLMHPDEFKQQQIIERWD